MRVFDLLEKYKDTYIAKDALAVKRDKQWEYFSSEDYIRLSHRFAYGLMALGYKKGDKIATISNNRPEWNFTDMGMAMLGVVHVPIYPTISESEYTFILEHSAVRSLIVSDKLVYKRIANIVSNVKSIEAVYAFNKDVEGVEYWDDIMALGAEKEEEYQADLEKIKASISEDDLFTLIYTSGTTGISKGVMLSHKNILSNAIATVPIQPMAYGDRTLSFLPLSHVYERMMNYNYQYKGISIYYAESLATIVANLKEIKANGFNTVPRVLEKIYDNIIAKGKDLKGFKKRIFFWAVRLAFKYQLHGNSWWYNKQLAWADKLVYSKWRQAFGGELKLAVSGGSSLQKRLARFFYAAGIPILEGYGMTETAPVIAVNHHKYPNIRFGTVGPVLAGVEVKIADDGEILCKGPNVMLGYYNAPELTAEAIDEDGWMHTGDIGVLEDGKFLKITDRKKEIFKLSSGKYVAPQALENLLKASNFIEQAMIVGENEKFTSAIISPNFNYWHFWASKHRVHYRSNADLIQHPKVVARMQKEINYVNKQISVAEKVKRFRMVSEEWTPASGRLSPTLKLKRKVLYAEYEPLLKEIYAVGSNGK